MNPLSHEYSHENSYILTCSKIGTGMWLEKIRKYIPNFIADNTENKIIFFEGCRNCSLHGGECSNCKCIYSLQVFMNIACVYPLFTHNNNPLSEHLSSILRYLSLTIKNLGKSRELLGEIGFKFFMYLGGDPEIETFTKTRKTRMTILDTFLPGEYSEYRRLLDFDKSGEFITPYCKVNYCTNSYSTLFNQPLTLVPEVKNRCTVCGLEDEQKICTNCQSKSNFKFPQISTPSFNFSKSKPTSAFNFSKFKPTPAFNLEQNKQPTFGLENKSIFQSSIFGQNSNPFSTKNSFDF
jgi:hypothetical protein